MNRWVALALVFLIALSPVGGQQRGANGQAAGEEDTESMGEPSEEDEFPAWLHSLRRAEVILVGAFPITMLFSSLAYDGFKTIRTAVQDGAVEGSANAELGQFTDTERRGILIAGVSLSAIVSLVDFLIVRRDRSAK